MLVRHTPFSELESWLWDSETRETLARGLSSHT